MTSGQTVSVRESPLTATSGCEFSTCIGQECSVYVLASEWGRFHGPSFRCDLKLEYHAKTFWGRARCPERRMADVLGEARCQARLVRTQFAGCYGQCDGDFRSLKPM